MLQVKAKFVEREVEIAAHVYTNDAKQGGLIIDILRLEVSTLTPLYYASSQRVEAVCLRYGCGD
jgi:hypothetical protein